MKGSTKISRENKLIWIQWVVWRFSTPDGWGAFIIGYAVNLTETPLKSQHCRLQCQTEGGKIRYMKIRRLETDHVPENEFIAVGPVICQAFKWFLWPGWAATKELYPLPPS